MLQERRKQNLYSCLNIIALFLTLVSCRPDSSSFSGEKATYLADYESPLHYWGYIDTTGKLAVPSLYDEEGRFSEGKAAVNKDGLWGYIDRTGKLIIHPQFRSAYPFHENRARVKPFNMPESFVSPSGTLISSPTWNATDDFSNGRARVKSGGLYGFIDTTGKVVINPTFSRAWDFDHHMAIVESQGKQGVIDLSGNYLIPPDYDHIIAAPMFALVLAIHENNSAVLDLSGQVLVQIPQASAQETDGHLISLHQKGKMWLYDLMGKKMLPGDGYDQLVYLGDQCWAAKKDSVYHLLNDEGMEINSLAYTQINKFENRMAVYQRDQFWGYLDASGKELTTPTFGLAWDYHDGFARVAFKDGIAYLNQNQDIAFYPPAGAMDIRDFNEGYAPVQMIKE